jgi:hypothetical protein
MPLDRAGTEEEARADLRVRQPVTREPRDLPLLRSQIVARLGLALADCRRWPAAPDGRAAANASMPMSVNIGAQFAAARGRSCAGRRGAAFPVEEMRAGEPRSSTSRSLVRPRNPGAGVAAILRASVTE